MTGISILDVTEAVILATPPGPDGDKLRGLTQATNPGIEFIPAPLPEYILIHREYPRVDLMLMPHLKGEPHERPFKLGSRVTIRR